MSYKPNSLFRMIEQISRNELLLPHIQRPFVWDEEQMIRLFDSLMRNYPVQTLLFWRTKEEIKARRLMAVIDRDADLSSLYDRAKSAAGVEKVFILDGQQRLQTLFALFAGGVVDRQGSESAAFFDVTSGETDLPGSDLRYRLVFSPSKLELPFYRIRNLMEGDAQKDASTIGDDLNDLLDRNDTLDNEDRRRRQRKVRSNISQLRTILREELHFWVEELDGVASKYEYRTILDIFVRVNSGGTKLTASDLMFAALKEGWSDIEENTEQTVDLLNEGRLGFETNFPLKCLLVAHGDGAEVNDVTKFVGEAGERILTKIKNDWPRAERAFRELRDFIKQDLRLFSDKVVRSYNAFVPLFDFLYHNPAPDPRSRVLMRAYYNKAQLFNWFGVGTDATINALHSVVGATISPFPLEKIKQYFAGRGLPTALQAYHFNDNRLRSIILSMLYVESWGTSPFDVRYKGNEPHADHIYPQSMLRTRLGLLSADINDIGNMRFVGATDNIRKRAELPASYFSRLKADGIDVERHLLVKEYADDPSLLDFTIDAFSKFRDARHAAIATLARKVVDPELQGL